MGKLPNRCLTRSKAEKTINILHTHKLNALYSKTGTFSHFLSGEVNMLKQILTYISTLPSQLRNSPKTTISVVVILLATTGLAFYLWNDVKASGSWKTTQNNKPCRLILLEKENGTIDGTGSFLGDNSFPFTITGFRTNRFVSLKFNTFEAVFQGKLKGRNELTGEIIVPSDGESKGGTIPLSLNRE